ncbi:hypothetical protein [Sphingomonas sp. KR3-1]|uniref:hypothetical protein n=1 Tax=Sphingomonas sp. KR3-1 TaxID=3156611 RepID=UPI0032B51634
MADNPSYPIGTCTTSWFDSSHALHIRVYSSDGYTITEQCDDGNGWTTGATFSGAQASVTTWADSAGQHIRLYVTGSNLTTEYCYDPGTSGWTKGQYVQP